MENAATLTTQDESIHIIKTQHKNLNDYMETHTNTINKNEFKFFGV